MEKQLTKNPQLANMEYEALRAEERDRINHRLQVWTLYLSLVGAFGFASIQTSGMTYVIALCPPLLACLARYARQSEDVLRQIRKYLYQMEKNADYQGYEHFSREFVRTSHGGHVKALRDTFVLTQLLATSIVTVRLVADHMPQVSLLVLVGEVISLALTMVWLWK